MKAPGPSSGHSGLWSELWNSSGSLHLARRVLRDTVDREELYFAEYVPPARDAITVPRHIVYVLIGAAVVVVGTYAITSHLIKDLLHDLADWFLGSSPEEEEEEEEPVSSGGEGKGREKKVRWGKRSTQMKEKITILPGFKLSIT